MPAARAETRREGYHARASAADDDAHQATGRDAKGRCAMPAVTTEAKHYADGCGWSDAGLGAPARGSVDDKLPIGSRRMWDGPPARTRQ